MPRRPPLLSLLRLALFSFLCVCSAALLYSTSRNVRTALALANQALESTAAALAATTEAGLRGSGHEVRRVLSDRVVAYAMIVGAEGRIEFHTNPGLVGGRVPKAEFARWGRSEEPRGRRILLGTGLPAYEYRHPMRAPDGARQVLRLVLHTVEVDRIGDEAKRLWWVAAAVLTALWSLGLGLDRVLSRHFRLQEEGLRREKLALVGQMTATLAHEIRNALGSVKGFAQWVDEKLDSSDGLKAGTRAILQGTARIESLVHDLLAYSREETYRLAPVAVGQALSRALAGFESQPGRVEVSADDALHALVDEEKLHRVLTNGIRNAIEAMGGDGSLKLFALERGRSVEIRIDDAGPGVPPESADRVFTPFFTTKASGTGLGLAYSRKVVEAMGGRIDLMNLEAGARLSILLPKYVRT